VVDGASHRAEQLKETCPPRPFPYHREGDRKGWSTVLVTALGSWGNPAPRGHSTRPYDKARHWQRNGKSSASEVQWCHVKVKA
jgi:hypothetical protein